MDSKLQEKYLKQLEEIETKYGRDRENHHVMADELLCELLIELGFNELVEKYKSVEKWYA